VSNSASPSTNLQDGKDDWIVAHQELSRLAKERAAADAEEGRWLIAALRSAAHVHLGFGSFAEYVERLFGYKPRSTQEKLRVAEALEQLPELATQLELGAVSWSAVRELTRVAVRETEDEWLSAAKGKTVRQLEELVAGKLPGDRPMDPNRESARRHVLRFEVSSETFALFREAIQQMRRNTDVAFDDDAALLAMARQALGGPSDEGRSGHQIALTVCAKCGQGRQISRGELVAVGNDVVEMASCDAQQVDCVSSGAANTNAVTTKRDAHVGVHDKEVHLQSPRATQTIPPAVRRAVLIRDQRCCRVPGCKHSTFLDVHHIVLRSKGGRNDIENLLTLCGAHHRAAHRGQLRIEKASGGEIVFSHADGSAYGRAVTPPTEVHAKVLSALCGLGFRRSDAQRALSESSPAANASCQRLLRDALERLTRPSASLHGPEGRKPQSPTYR
jgi:hypothetical protein